MPRTIRRALYRKLRELPEMAEFQRDFELVSGMKLAFLDELGLGDDLDHAEKPLCRELQGSEAGRSMCARMRHSLLAGAEEKPCSMTCDAGLREMVVPLHTGGIRAGYLVFGGVRSTPVDPPSLNKVAHLLRRNGIHFEESRLEQYFRSTQEIPHQTLEAYLRLVQVFARQLGLKLTDHLGEPDSSIPPVVQKACRFIRVNAMLENINLGTLARHCGVSTGHLSRIFHHSTGLTFREYLAQIRIENARELLLRSQKNVTEVAYDSGFQSLSQFYRVFQKAFGVSPGKLRASKNMGRNSPDTNGPRSSSRRRK